MLLNYIHLLAPSYSIFRRRVTQLRRPLTLFFGTSYINRTKSANSTGVRAGNFLLLNTSENLFIRGFVAENTHHYFRPKSYPVKTCRLDIMGFAPSFAIDCRAWAVLTGRT